MKHKNLASLALLTMVLTEPALSDDFRNYMLKGFTAFICSETLYVCVNLSAEQCHSMVENAYSSCDAVNQMTDRFMDELLEQSDDIADAKLHGATEKLTLCFVDALKDRAQKTDLPQSCLNESVDVWSKARVEEILQSREMRKSRDSDSN